MLCSQTADAYSLAGVQSVAKFRQSQSSSVLIVMGVIRIPDVQTDIVVTHNHPLVPEEELLLNQHGKMVGMGSAIVTQVLKTLEVRDWSLFT